MNDSMRLCPSILMLLSTSYHGEWLRGLQRLQEFFFKKIKICSWSLPIEIWKEEITLHDLKASERISAIRLALRRGNLSLHLKLELMVTGIIKF
jgi:hypothetical protein